MQTGDTFTQTHIFTQDDFVRFARLSGDDNPIHVDAKFASTTRFGKTVAHGMLLYSVLCGALKKHFPHSAQLEQTLMFPTPTYVGEEITIRLEIAEQLQDEKRVRVLTSITRPNGDVGLQGETWLRYE